MFALASRIRALSLVLVPWLAAITAITATTPTIAHAERGQPPAGEPFQERVEVRLVQVDAWATDSGKPVYDLKQSELQLTEDGKPVDILYFAAPIVDQEAPPVAPAAPGEGDAVAAEPVSAPAAPAPEPAVVAIFLDESHLGIGSRAKTIAALRDWIAKGGLPRGADTMLVAHERELKVVLGRTRDQARLLDALDHLGNPSTVGVGSSIEERRTLEAIREHQRNSMEQMRPMPGPPGAQEAAEASGGDTVMYFEPPCSGRLLRYAEDLADVVTIEAKATLESLAGFADSLAALRGRKLLVFVSEGIPSRPGGAAFDYVRTLCDGSGLHAGIQYSTVVSTQSAGGALQGQLDAATLALAGENRHITSTVDQVVARANSSGVSVWSFGARGLTQSGADAAQDGRMMTPEAQTRQQAEAEDVLNALAVDTGGRAILQSNDFGTALGQLADDLFHSYSLAFSSPRAGDGKLHRIGLETTRPGVRLRYRKSWRDSSKEEELAGLVGGALAYGVDRPGLGAVATIGRQHGEAGAERLILRLTMPRAALTSLPAEKGGRQGFLLLAISLRPAGGTATPVRTRKITIDVAAAGANAAEPIVQDIALPEIGRGALVAVGVRDELSGEIGLFRLEVGGT